MDAPHPLSLAGLRDLLGARTPHILDTRSREQVEAGHLSGAAWLPVTQPSAPKAELPAFLLPQRGSPLLVVADDASSARAIAAHLRARGYDAAYLADPLPPAPAAAAAGLLLGNGRPTGHLWRPDPVLQKHVHLVPPPGAGPVVDLGSGSGRDAVFLALRGHDVLAVDRLPDALERLRRRADHHGVFVRTLHADLRRAVDVDHMLTGGPYATALLIRVHQPEVLRELARLVAPGGIALVHAFVRRGSPRAGDDACSPSAHARPHARSSLDRTGARERRPKAALSLDLLDATFAAPGWQSLLELDPPPHAERALAARIALRCA